MRDVAKRAGVSVATVSRALAGSPLVVPEVRDRVVAAADELDYVTNRLPANLRSSSSRTLALVVGNVRNPYFPDLIGGCEEAAQEAGYSLIFADSNEDPARESELLDHLALERVAGVALAAAGGPTKGLRRLRAVGTAVVEVDRYIAGLDLDTVCVNDADSVYGAMQHLLALGHRRIGFVGGPTTVSTGRDREAGYRRALGDAGIPVDPRLTVFGDFREARARELVAPLMGIDHPPTALVTVNNLATVGAMRALRALGLRIPADVSILGFDDMLAAELLDPPLTAIAQPTYAIGRCAIEVLLGRIRSPERPINNVVLETELVIRGSTGPVRT